MLKKSSDEFGAASFPQFVRKGCGVSVFFLMWRRARSGIFALDRLKHSRLPCAAAGVMLSPESAAADSG
jgi:hypothetical protein